jgi:Planctomycete cytochrome C/Anaphase-promoting complex subunit 4 WD40 domain
MRHGSRVTNFKLTFYYVSSLCSLCLCGANTLAQTKTNYVDHILPILRDSCIGCHGADKKRGGLAVHTYSELMQGGSSGAVVKPGDPEASRLFLLMAHKGEPAMPPKSPKLEQAKLDVVAKWIAEGALENSGSKAVVTKPNTDIGLTSIVRGKPAVLPMPTKPLPLEPVVRTAKANAITALASSPWAPLVAIGGQKQVLLYNSDTLDLLGVLPFPEGVPHVLKFSRNGSLLLAGGGRGGKSGKVVLWKVATGERVVALGDETDAVLAADISADQTQVALGGPAKMIRIYSTKDGSLIREIKKHTDWIYTLEYSPDGVLLATADRGGGLFVWETHTGREYFSLRGHTGAITSLSWRMDSNVLGSISEDTTLRLWEMENGGLIKSWAAHGGGGQSLQFTHDNGLVSCGRDRVVKTWDQNGTALRSFEAMPDVAVRSCFTHDGIRVIAGDWTGSVRVWQSADGKPFGNLLANPPSVAERLDLATKDVIAKQTAYDQATATLKASDAAVVKASADLAIAQKIVTDAATLLKTTQDSVVTAKATADAEGGKVTTAQNLVTAKDALAKAFATAAAQVKAQADAAKTNPALGDAAVKVKMTADGATADLAAAQKTLADAQVQGKTATAALTKAQQSLTAAQANVAAARKNVESATAALKNAQTKAASDKATADAASAALTEAKARVERMKATIVATAIKP